MLTVSAKALIAVLVTGVGVSLMLIGERNAYAKDCPSQSCESCVFCSLATPACLDPCPSCHGQPVSQILGDSNGSDAGLTETLEAEILDPNELSIQQPVLTCPIAIDLMSQDIPVSSTPAPPSSP